MLLATLLDQKADVNDGITKAWWEICVNASEIGFLTMGLEFRAYPQTLNPKPSMNPCKGPKDFVVWVPASLNPKPLLPYSSGFWAFGVLAAESLDVWVDRLGALGV